MTKRVLMSSSLVAAGAVLLLSYQNCMQQRPAQSSIDQASVNAQTLLGAADGPCADWSSDAADFSTLAAGAELTGAVSGYYKISQLTSIHDASGSVAILAQSGGAANIGSIKNFSGTLYICNADVGSLENLDVNRVTIVGGAVGAVTNVKGTLVVKGGAVNGPVNAPDLILVNGQ